MNKDTTLIVLAAGLGSRYGGLKQIDTVGNNGESIIDFSIYDAIQAGFNHLILIIRPEHEALFEEHIGHKVRPFIDLKYAYQDVHYLPEGFTCPAERTKPWGTTHALLMTKGLVQGPFMVINADDFYGRESFEIMHNFLINEVSDDHYGMVGYQLTKTLTENGTVTRGVCQIEDDYLKSIVETKKIQKIGDDGYAVEEDGSTRKLPAGLVSMNYWGFTEKIFDDLEAIFENFLKESIHVDKSEHVIPTAVGQLIAENKITVKVMGTTAEWFGVTYPEDKEFVVGKLAQYKLNGIYPFDLWEVK